MDEGEKAHQYNVNHAGVDGVMFIANRPFTYYVKRKKSNMILFIGNYL
jgi:serine protease inhibitor